MGAWWDRMGLRGQRRASCPQGMSDPGHLRGLACHTPPSLHPGKKVKSQHKGCAPSCEVATKIMTQLSQMTSPESLSQGVLTKFEVQEVTCCEKDLCNGVARMARSSWALAGGLLLSLGPAFLRALP